MRAKYHRCEPRPMRVEILQEICFQTMILGEGEKPGGRNEMILLIVSTLHFTGNGVSREFRIFPSILNLF